MADISPLAAYLDEHDLSSAAFAAELGVDQTAVLRWRKGERWPTRKWALRIAEETDGAVPVDAWPVDPPRKLRSGRKHARRTRTLRADMEAPATVLNERGAAVSLRKSARRRAAGGGRE